jgi:type VII secretion protein EccB
VDEEGVLVRTPKGDTYLVLHSRRLAVRQPDQTLASLGWASEPRLTVGAAFLDAVTAGPDLEPPSVDGAGSAGPRVGGHAQTRVGEVFRVGDGDQFFVLTRGGLTGISATAATVLLGGTKPRAITPDEFASAPTDDAPVLPDGYPREVPTLARIDPTSPPALCARYRGGTGGQPDVEVRILADVPPALAGAPRVAGSRPAPGTADRVVVPAGQGALVRALPAPGVTSGPVYLVTDQGIRHPVTSSADVAALGYGKVAAIPVPTTFLGLLPIGAALSRKAAETFVPR